MSSLLANNGPTSLGSPGLEMDELISNLWSTGKASSGQTLMVTSVGPLLGYTLRLMRAISEWALLFVYDKSRHEPTPATSPPNARGDCGRRASCLPQR